MRTALECLQIITPMLGGLALIAGALLVSLPLVGIGAFVLLGGLFMVDR